jgi:ubiquitin C-terminal hydrolase
MNSVVQCLASFDVLEEFLENTGVLRELLDLITLLKVRKGPRTLRTRELVMELGKEKKDLFTYQQQDAQEFYQLLSFTITKQSTRVHLNGIGVNSVLGLEDSIPILFSGRKIHVEKRGKRSPLTGLLASRISCLQCRHQVIQLNKSPWRHDTFDNLSIPIPDQNGCTLESLLKSYTKPEFIDGYVCEKCTFLATKMKKMKKSDREWIETCLLNNTFDLKKVHQSNVA